MQAEYVVDQLGGKGNIAYLRGPIGHFAEVQRFEGTEEIFAQNPDIKIVISCLQRTASLTLSILENRGIQTSVFNSLKRVGNGIHTTGKNIRRYIGSTGNYVQC